MSIFNFFKGNRENSDATPTEDPLAGGIDNLSGSEEQMASSTSDNEPSSSTSGTTSTSNSTSSSSSYSEGTSRSRIYNISYASHLAIDAIYIFLNKDYSDAGYQDAMVNIDISYRQAGENLIRYNLKNLFKRVNIKYKEDIRQLESTIRNVKEMGLLMHASELESRLVTLKEHLEELAIMEDKLDRDDASMMCPIETYRRGFLKGIVARTSDFLK